MHARQHELVCMQVKVLCVKVKTIPQEYSKRPATHWEKKEWVVGLVLFQFTHHRDSTVWPVDAVMARNHWTRKMNHQSLFVLLVLRRGYSTQGQRGRNLLCNRTYRRNARTNDDQPLQPGCRVFRVFVSFPLHLQVLIWHPRCPVGWQLRRVKMSVDIYMCVLVCIYLCFIIDEGCPVLITLCCYWLSMVHPRTNTCLCIVIFFTFKWCNGLRRKRQQKELDVSSVFFHGTFLVLTGQGEQQEIKIMGRDMELACGIPICTIVQIIS